MKIVKKARKYEAIGGNTRFASGAVKCLHSSSFFQLGFSAGLTIKCSEIPPLSQSPKPLGIKPYQSKFTPTCLLFFCIFAKKF
jgi:hypothetical protein